MTTTRATRSLAIGLILGVGLLGSAAPAHAAKKPAKKAPRPAAGAPSCNLIKDEANDASGSGLVGADAGLDIVSGDISSDAKNVTVAIRLAGAPPAAGSQNAPDGTAYYLQWNVPGAANPVYLTAASDATGAFSYAMGSLKPQPGGGGSIYTNTAGAVTGKVTGSVITMSVDRSVLATLADVKPGVVLDGLEADAFYPLEVPMVGGALQSADSVKSAKKYTAGSPSCLKVGS